MVSKKTAMPTSYKIAGYGFVAALLLVAGVTIGAVLYERFVFALEPDDFWSRLQAIVGSLGVLAAIGMAIFTDLKVEGRFDKQIKTQTELDRRADERQQAEWSRQQDQQNAIQEERTERLTDALLSDLRSILSDLAQLRNEFTNSGIISLFKNERLIALDRPNYGIKAIANNIAIVDPVLVAPVCTIIPDIERDIKSISATLKFDTTREEKTRYIDKYLRCAIVRCGTAVTTVNFIKGGQPGRIPIRDETIQMLKISGFPDAEQIVPKG